jgi:adenylate cyclase
MYVSGMGARDGGLILSEADLASDVRFTELVAQFIGSVRQVRVLQGQKTRLSAFFSPKVIDSLTAIDGSNALSPAERNITVLFCDIRGFSRKAEQLQHDLLSLLESVRSALGVMVAGILKRDGAIADLQGDAALGFWGWPVALEYGPVPACRAALTIGEEFRKAADQPGSLLHGFSVGIGVAHGRAVAGQIGTDQHSKVGVFGPVVNQGARLEGLTKQFDVSICIDGPTAEFVDRYVSSSEGRLRPLARVRPNGMNTPVDVFNLLPAEDECSEVSCKMIADHEAALEAVTAGKWEDAARLLTRLPDEDGPRQFLMRQMGMYGNSPPSNWDGAFCLAGK